MLETINLLVGLAVVMLLVSFAVTMITQIISNLLNLRGCALRMKVTNLLVLIDNGLDPKDAAQIAGLVLRDALVGQPGLVWRGQLRKPPAEPVQGGAAPKPPLFELGRRPAAVIHREELTRLLLSFGKKRGEYPDTWRWFCHPLVQTARLQQTMRASLEHNGVDDPDEFLAHIRKHSLALERKKPELSNSERVNDAILTYGASEFIGKLYGWFDQTADRAADLFTVWTHVTTIAVALAVAATLQLDTPGLINRLSTDPTVRARLVEWAVQNVNTAGGDTNTLKDKVVASAQSALATDNLIALPSSFEEWWARWSVCPPSSPQGPGCKPRLSLYVGVLISTMLLSLGGPFWYEMLKNLLKLRSTLAGKEEDERRKRQTHQPGDDRQGAAAA
jgi:hypothetical protein